MPARSIRSHRLLPIALGEATKTVPFVMDGRKTLPLHGALGRGARHRRRRRQGRRRRATPARPRPRSRRCLPRFTGTIMQMPPKFSAIKIEGERAYDLARDGEMSSWSRARSRSTGSTWSSPDPDHAVFEAECGKGTYVRALARDIGRVLGCLGHVAALRRTAVGPFGESDMISLAELEALCHKPPPAREASPTRYCPLRPRWTTSRRWPSAGQMRQGSNGARPFCCADGMPPFSAARSM